MRFLSYDSLHLSAGLKCFNFFLNRVRRKVKQPNWEKCEKDINKQFTYKEIHLGKKCSESVAVGKVQIHTMCFPTKWEADIWVLVREGAGKWYSWDPWVGVFAAVLENNLTASERAVASISSLEMLSCEHQKAKRRTFIVASFLVGQICNYQNVIQ